MSMLLFCAHCIFSYPLFHIIILVSHAEINVNSMESWADDIMGAECIDEYKAILQKLGKTRRNHVFQAFGIKAPQHVAAIRHQAAEEKRKQTKEAQGAKVAGGASTTAQLEQKKRKPSAKTSGPPKQTCVTNILLGASSPLKVKGDSKDTRDEKARPLTTPPLASAPPPPSEPRVSDSGSGKLPLLEVSDQEAKSDEDDGEQINIVGSPIGGTKTRTSSLPKQI